MSIVENSRTKLTYEDYVGFPDDLQRHEIIDGDHYVTPSPVSYHQLVSGDLFVGLYRPIQEAGRGKVISAPMDVLLSRVDIVQPDIIVILEGNTSIITEKNIQGAPDLVVEILSPSTSARDRNLKKALYERVGVREYWIVDLDNKRIEQFVMNDDGKYDDAGEHDSSGDDKISARFVSGVTVDLTKVW